MCGIGGYWGDFTPELLGRMSVALAHRGPDDKGVWSDQEQRLGLAHTRLSIIDLSAGGHQPMIDGDGPGVITFNGEIYNYLELREKLLIDGFRFQSTSDTEVLLKLYHRDGPEMLSTLNGIFAFAIWDRCSQRLFLARDAVGVKPLYYTLTSKGFLFASELKAILQEPTVDRAIDIEAVEQYLTYLWCPAPKSPLRAVQKLEPGQAMILRHGKIDRTWYFYDLPYSERERTVAEQDAVAELKERTAGAVRRQMVADVPVGAFLSGGLDSSAVVSIAKDSRPAEPLHCFTIDAGASSEGFVEDLPYAKKVAKHLGVDLHVVKVGSDFIKKLPFMIYHLDEPQSDPAPLHVFHISKLAREHGMKVLLSGAGGDDIFTGYRRHYALMFERWWSWMPSYIRKGLSRSAVKLNQNHPMGRRISKAFRFANLSGDDRLISYFFWIEPLIVKQLLSEDSRASLNGADPFEPLRKSLNRLPRDVDPLNKMLYLEAKHFLADHNLNYTDKMSMAAGLEVRVPLLDVDLIAFAASLPVNFKQNGGVGKWLFKKSMEGVLPREVIYRPKSGFGAPLRQWMHKDLVAFVDRLLGKESISNRGIFDHLAVRQLISEDRAGRIDASYTIFSLVCFEIWCRIFLDGQHYDDFEL